MKLDALKHPDLMRLRNEGYDIQIVGTHLLLKSIPYVARNLEVRRDGAWVTPIQLEQGDQTAPPKDHTAYFIGDLPHYHTGVPMNDFIIETNNKELIPGVTANFKFSYKFTDGNGGWRLYKDHYEKMKNYIRLVLDEARALKPDDPEIRADVFPQIPPEYENSPFEYEDTSSSRSGITALSEKLALTNVAIIGLGGTGSYVLDLIAKTPIKNIHLFDDDDFHQHNAFRSPGVVHKEKLIRNLKKVNHYSNIYSSLHKGIQAHPVRITAGNLDQLDNMNFVFICLDCGDQKESIMGRLEEKNIAFIDVGMGVQSHDNEIQAMLRITSSTEGHRNHIRDNHRISFAPAPLADEIYRTNIQIADLNSMNAALAVIKWKKICGYYADLEKEHHSVYVTSMNTLSNDDL